MKELINKICMPVALFGAINYGLIGLFSLDLLGYLSDSTLVQIASIVIGVAGVGAAYGWVVKK